MNTVYKVESLTRRKREVFLTHRSQLARKMSATDTKATFNDGEPKAALEALEDVSEAERLLVHFPILQDKSPEELEGLNKAVLRKLDWYFLPCVTMMLLMR